MSSRRGMGIFVALALAASSAATFTGSAPADAAAPATPNVGKLAGSLAKQKLAWTPCVKELQNEAKEVMCATVKVPKDWHNVDVKDTWDVEISHLKNRDPSHSRYQGTIFMNPGGPGGSGLHYPGKVDEAMPDLMPYYNILGFEPRGIKGLGSSDAGCTYSYAEGASEWEQMEAFGKTCSQNKDIKTLNTEQVAYDMDFIRHLLKLPKVDYIGYSYGTWLGAWYSKVFGAKYGGRFVLDSALDVNQPWLGHAWVWNQVIARERQQTMHFDLWEKRKPKDPGEPKGSARAGSDKQARATLTKAGAGSFDFASRAAVSKELVGRKPAGPADVRSMLTTEEIGSAKGLHRSVLKDQLRMLDKLSALDKAPQKKAPRRTSGSAKMVEVTDSSYVYQIACNDGQWRQGKDWYEQGFAKPTKAQQEEAGNSAVAPCAYWRTDTVMPDIPDPKTYPETIVVQSELDGATAWELGRASGLTLPNTSFIAVDNESAHGIFPYGTEEVDGPILDFFLTGKRPPNVTITQAKPFPKEEVTYEYWTPLFKGAKHHGSPNTDPWRVAGGGVATPRPVEVTGADLTAAPQAATSFTRWVAQTYGPQGMDVLAKEAKK